MEAFMKKHIHLISVALLVATALIYTSCGGLNHSRPLGKFSFTLDEATAGNIARVIVNSPRTANGTSENELEISFKVVNTGNQVIKETAPKIIPLSIIRETAVKNAILDNSTYTIEEIPLNTKLKVYVSIVINGTEIIGGSSETFELSSADTQAVSISLSLNRESLTTVLSPTEPYAGLLPLWHYDWKSSPPYHFYLTTTDSFSEVRTEKTNSFYETNSKSDFYASCFDLKDRLWYIAFIDGNAKLFYTSSTNPSENGVYSLYKNEGNSKREIADIDCDPVTGKLWICFTLRDYSENTKTYYVYSFDPEEVIGNEHYFDNKGFNNDFTPDGCMQINETAMSSSPIHGAVVNNTYYLATEEGERYDGTYECTLHKAQINGSEITPTQDLGLIESGYLPDADKSGLSTYIQDIATLEEGVFVLFRQDGYETNSHWFISRGGLLWLEPDTLQKKDITGVTPFTNASVSVPLLIRYDGYTSAIFYDEAGSKQIMTDYSFWHGVPTKNEKNFYAPVRFLAVKPKKLVIADNGVYMYCDTNNTNNLTTETASRVVTVDLESFSDPVYSEISADFGASKSGSSFTYSSYTDFDYMSDFYAKKYESGCGFIGNFTLKAGLTDDQLDNAPKGIKIEMYRFQ